MRRREPPRRELVGSGLVRANLEKVRIRSDLVERATEENLVRRNAGQVERTRGKQEDLVGSTGEVILAIAAVFEIRDHRLSGLPEITQGIAQLLHLDPE